MNIYIVIEGEKAIKKLYTTWISFTNKQLSPVNNIADFRENNFFIVAGFGQPNYWSIVENAVRDVNQHKNIHRLVISVDSEDSTYDEKLNQAQTHIERIGCKTDVKYVIQHFCIETWLLGNVYMFRKHPQDQELIDYLQNFDIRSNDPELLPPNTQNSWNRSQFAFRYLKAGIRDIYGSRKSYNKSNPGIACDEGYFYQVRKRHLEDKHISSFGGFLTAFV